MGSMGSKGRSPFHTLRGCGGLRLTDESTLIWRRTTSPPVEAGVCSMTHEDQLFEVQNVDHSGRCLPAVGAAMAFHAIRLAKKTSALLGSISGVLDTLVY